MAQKNSVLKHHALPGQRGFVFAPFVEDKTFKNIFIRAEIFADTGKLPGLNFAATRKRKPHATKAFKHAQASKAAFKTYVKKIRHGIRQGKLDKVVAARTALKKAPTGFEPVTFFQKLCKQYPQAFVSLVYTREYGLSIGASPEVLLQADRREFKTYSLAGTKANNEKNAKMPWGKKEKEEQQLVSGFIVKCFKKVSNKVPVIEGPLTVTAGNLLHLRTTFLYKGLPLAQWPGIIKHMHPTPAVAGLPRKKAIDFIVKHEISPRGFYSGYLGPVNVEGSVNLFVNLRCMQVLKNKLALHVGCGITKDSVPEKEWMESKIKTETLLNVMG